MQLYFFLNELSLEDSSIIHSSSISHPLSSCIIPSITEIPSSFTPTYEEFYSACNNGVHSGAPSKELSPIAQDTCDLDLTILSFKQHVIAASYDFESVNSEDYEESLTIAKDKELHMDVSCDTLEFTKYVTTNRNDMSTYSFVEDLTVTSSCKLNAKLHEFSTLHDKYLTTSPSPLHVHGEITDTSNIKHHEPSFITPSSCVYGNNNNSTSTKMSLGPSCISSSSTVGRDSHTSCSANMQSFQSNDDPSNHSFTLPSIKELSTSSHTSPPKLLPSNLPSSPSKEISMESLDSYPFST